MKTLVVIYLSSVVALLSQSTALPQPAPDASASPAVPGEATAPPNKENDEPQVLKTSPTGAFRIVEDGEEYWIESTATASDRTKMHSAELASPEEFCFSPDEHWLYV